MTERRSVFPELGARPRVLVPVIKGQMARPIVSLGDALLAFPGASGSLLALVEADPTITGRLGTQDERRRDMLRWVASLEYDGAQRRRMSVTIRVTTDVAGSIRNVVAETQSTSVVLEWPSAQSPRRARLTALMSQVAAAGVPADVLFVRPDPAKPNREVAPRSILVPIRGGANARAVVATAAALADAYGSRLTLLHVQPSNSHPDRSRREWETFGEIVAELRRPTTRVRHLEGEAPAGILAESAGHDLLILGSRFNPQYPQLLIGRALMGTVRQIRSPVVVMRVRDVGWSAPEQPPPKAAVAH